MNFEANRNIVDNTVFEDSLELNIYEIRKKYYNDYEYIWGPDLRERSAVYGDLVGITDTDFKLYKDYTGKKVEGGIRHRIMLERSCERKLLKPSTNATELYLNLLEDCSRGVIDRRGIMNKDLMEISVKAMNMSEAEIETEFKDELKEAREQYQKKHPDGVVSKGGNKTMYQNYRKEQVWDLYRQGKTVKEISEVTGISENTIRDSYGFKDSDNSHIDVSGKSRMTQYRHKKKSGGVLSRLSYEEAKEIYPEMKGKTISETKNNFERSGYQVSPSRIRSIKREIDDGDVPVNEIKIEQPKTEPQSEISQFGFPGFQLPNFMGNLQPPTQPQEYSKERKKLDDEWEQRQNTLGNQSQE